jgi:hypothetical protein
MEILVGVLSFCRSKRHEGGLSHDNADNLILHNNRKRIRARCAIRKRQSKSVAKCCLLRSVLLYFDIQLVPSAVLRFAA